MSHKEPWRIDGEFQDEHFNLGDEDTRAAMFSLNDGLLFNVCVLAAAYPATGSDWDAMLAAGLLSAAANSVKAATGFFVSSHVQNEREKEELMKEESHLRRFPMQEQQHLIDTLTKQICALAPETRRALQEDVERSGAGKHDMELRMHAELELGLDADQVDEDPSPGALAAAGYHFAGGLIPVLPFFVLPLYAALLVTVAVAALAQAVICYQVSYITSRSKGSAAARQLLTFAWCAACAYALGSATHYLSTHSIEIVPRPTTDGA